MAPFKLVVGVSFSSSVYWLSYISSISHPLQKHFFHYIQTLSYYTYMSFLTMSPHYWIFLHPVVMRKFFHFRMSTTPVSPLYFSPHSLHFNSHVILSFLHMFFFLPVLHIKHCTDRGNGKRKKDRMNEKNTEWKLIQNWMK